MNIHYEKIYIPSGLSSFSGIRSRYVAGRMGYEHDEPERGFLLQRTGVAIFKSLDVALGHVAELVPDGLAQNLRSAACWLCLLAYVVMDEKARLFERRAFARVLNFSQSLVITLVQSRGDIGVFAISRDDLLDGPSCVAALSLVSPFEKSRLLTSSYFSCPEKPFPEAA